MEKTLENLYYGNLRPCEQRINAGSEQRRAVDTISRCEDQLESQLDEAGQKILSEMSEAQRTADNITALENFILGFRLGDKKMNSILPVDVQRMYIRLQKEGRVHEHPELGHELSASTIRRIHTMLHRAFEDAVQVHVLPRNPAEGLALPKADQAPRRVLTDQELDTFTLSPTRASSAPRTPRSSRKAVSGGTVICVTPSSRSRRC